MIRPRQNKYHAQKVTIDGVIFSSKAEAEMYQLLRADKNTRHIDVHVPLSLVGGVRYSVDFIVWLKNKEKPEAIEVKGVVGPDFRTKYKLFNQFHPLAPLKVFRKVGKKWASIYAK